MFKFSIPYLKSPIAIRNLGDSTKKKYTNKGPKIEIPPFNSIISLQFPLLAFSRHVYAKTKANIFPIEVKEFIKITLFPLYYSGTISVMLETASG